MGLVGVSGAGGGLGEGDARAGQRQGPLEAQDAGQRLGAVAERGQRTPVQAAGAQARLRGRLGDAAAGAQGPYDVAEQRIGRFAGPGQPHGDRLQLRRGVRGPVDALGQPARGRAAQQITQLGAPVAQFVAGTPR